MSARLDVERGPQLEKPFVSSSLRDDTLVTQHKKIDDPYPSRPQAHSYGVRHLIMAFALGASAGMLAHLSLQECNFVSIKPSVFYTMENVYAFASPNAGSTSVHNYPPPHPTNANPSLFPSNVGLAGGTPTGGEAGIVATAPAYPMNTGQCSHELIAPAKLKAGVGLDDEDGEITQKNTFNILQSWGSLSPWYSVKRGRFGVHSTAQAPEGCRVTGLHLLHRHGARYPTAWGEHFLFYSFL